MICPRCNSEHDGRCPLWASAKERERGVPCSRCRRPTHRNDAFCDRCASTARVAGGRSGSAAAAPHFSPAGATDALQPPAGGKLVKDVCRHGHEMTADNVYVRPDGGGRQCRACKRTRQLRYDEGRPRRSSTPWRRPRRGRRSAEQRFDARVDRTGDCWIWLGSVTNTGYAKFSIGNRTVQGHRWAYEHYAGPIPDGLQLDHLCRVRNCVNPDHLEPVTAAENIRRAREANRVSSP